MRLHICFISNQPQEQAKKSSFSFCKIWKNMVNIDFGEGMVGVSDKLIRKSCAMAMKLHKNQDKQYRIEKHSYEVVFAFPRLWLVSDWIGNDSFGSEVVDLLIFPSLRFIGRTKDANVNGAFMRRFKEVLANQKFRDEVEKAVKDGKRVVFSGYAYGGAIAILATIWFLDQFIRPDPGKTAPLCLTFGSPLVGDHIMNHALRRQNWARYFIHFIMTYDIVPRISLSPFSSNEQKQQLQQILDFFRSPTREVPDVATEFFETAMRDTSSVASCAACKITGCTNPMLETMLGFVELSPYRPSGTWVFCTGNGELIVEKNPEAVLQLLSYSWQLSPEDSVSEIARRSLKDHLAYEGELRECLKMISITHLDHLDAIPLSSNEGNVETASINKALDNLNLSSRARLCLRATIELERQKLDNQTNINLKKEEKEKGIKTLLEKLEAYKSRCTLKKIGYYNAFKLSKDEEDFQANVARLELAGIWDEISDMLKKNQLPDVFETEEEWIELGTRYRRLSEPLDIANFYRHLKNEDTGAYMKRGRPKRYKCAQRWRDYTLRLSHESLESCFWAEVEELRNKSGKPGVKEKAVRLVKQVQEWIKNGDIKKDDVLLEGSSYMKLLREYSLTNMHMN